MSINTCITPIDRESGKVDDNQNAGFVEEDIDFETKPENEVNGRLNRCAPFGLKTFRTNLTLTLNPKQLNRESRERKLLLLNKGKPVLDNQRHPIV